MLLVDLLALVDGRASQDQLPALEAAVDQLLEGLDHHHVGLVGVSAGQREAAAVQDHAFLRPRLVLVDVDVGRDDDHVVSVIALTAVTGRVLAVHDVRKPFAVKLHEREEEQVE